MGIGVMVFKNHCVRFVGNLFLSIASISSITCDVGNANAQAATPSGGIQFDMPAITTAIDTTPAGESRAVTFDLSISSLLVGATSDITPPFDHMLVQVRLRDRQPILDYFPKTELQTDYAGPIAISKKSEQTDSFGLSADSVSHNLGAVHLGVDDQTKQSDNTQFERHAPMQAVVAAGTIDRGQGVYFKLRWTAQQVLEGEKHFRVSVAVPETWRGGLVDVDITAHRADRSLFGDSKVREVTASRFVIAICQENDPLAAELSLRLAQLDQRLASMASRPASTQSNPVAEFWKRVLPKSEKPKTNWYRLVTTQQADPYTDKRIQSLPMPIRVAVLDYTDASRQLQQLRGKSPAS